MEVLAVHCLWDTKKGPVCVFWRPWKARSMEELAVHGLWENKEGPVCDFWRPWKARSMENLAVHGLWETNLALCQSGRSLRTVAPVPVSDVI